MNDWIDKTVEGRKGTIGEIRQPLTLEGPVPLAANTEVWSINMGEARVGMVKVYSPLDSPEVLMVRELGMDVVEVLDKTFLMDLDAAIMARARETGKKYIEVWIKPRHKSMYKAAGYKETVDEGVVRKAVPEALPISVAVDILPTNRILQEYGQRSKGSKPKSKSRRKTAVSGLKKIK